MKLGTTIFSLLFACATSLSSAWAEAPEKMRFGDWSFECDGNICQVFSALAEKTSGKVAYSVSFLKDPSAGVHSIIILVPLGVAVPPGIKAYSDQTKLADIPIQFCDVTGCRAIAKLTPDNMAALAKSANLNVQFVTYGKTQAEVVRMPLNGLTDALRQLGKTDIPMQPAAQ